MRRGPRKHQNAIQGHQFLGPDHASQAEDKIGLNDKTKDQIKVQSVHTEFLGDDQILLHCERVFKRKSAFSEPRVSNTGAQGREVSIHFGLVAGRKTPPSRGKRGKVGASSGFIV